MVDGQIEILSTKFLDGAIIQQAASKNIVIDCVPFIQIKTIATPELQQQIVTTLEEKDFVIFTSANAVEAVAQEFHTKPKLNVFCISGKTRKAVEGKFPGSSIIADAPTGADLARKIIDAKIQSAVFFCGNKRLDTIPNTLKAHQIKLTEIVVYETLLTPHKIEQDYNGVLFFSPSAVESFFNVNEPKECPIAFSFAASTYHSLQPIIKEIILSQTPSEQGMLNAVIHYYRGFSFTQRAQRK